MLWRPPNIPYLTFLKFCPTPLPHCFKPSPPLLFLMPCFFNWMGDCATFDVLFHLMILWIYNCWALAPTRHQIYWGLTHNVVFFLVPLFDITHTHTHKDTQHTQNISLKHSYKYILTPSAMRSQQLCVLHWIIHWYQKFAFQCLYLKKITHL